MQIPTGFENQDDYEGICGQRSLVHALLLNGIPVTQKDVHNFTGVPYWLANIKGTNEDEVKRGIRNAGCVPRVFSDTGELRARKSIDDLLLKNIPVIVYSFSDDHWAVLAGKRGNSYYWIDSADDELYGVWSWTDIADWISDDDEYFFIGVEPKDKTQLSHSIVGKFPKVYDMFDDDDLAEYWGYYLEDLSELFDSPKDSKNSVSAKEFFDTYGGIILDSAGYYYIDTDEDYIEWELENYKKVAVSHNLSISNNKIVEAVSALSAALTVIGCGLGED